MNVDDLRLLLALARTGRMISAGAALGIDHTTVSRRIRRLEKSLGATLVQRGSDGWELTEIGRSVVDRAAPLDVLVQQVRDIASGENGTLRGTVRIAAPDGFGVSFLTPAIATVLAEHPHVSVELVTSTRPLSSRGAGFDLSVSIGVPSGGRLATEVLTPYSLALYASRDYVALHSPIAAVDDLGEHILIFYVDSLLSVAELDLTRSFSGLRVGFGSTNVAAQLEATKHGIGVGLLPCFLGEPEPELVPVLQDEVRFELSFSLSARRDSAELPAVRAIREALHAEVAARRSELVPPRG